MELFFFRKPDSLFSFNSVCVCIDASQKQSCNPGHHANGESKEKAVAHLLDWFTREMVSHVRQSLPVDVGTNSSNTESNSESERKFLALEPLRDDGTLRNTHALTSEPEDASSCKHSVVADLGCSVCEYKLTHCQDRRKQDETEP